MLGFAMCNIMNRRALIGLATFAVLASAMGGQNTPIASVGSGSEAAAKLTFEFAGVSRTYYSFIPEDKGPLPIVVLLHGSGRDGRVMVDAWRDLASKDRFIVVAPNSYDPAGWAFKTDSPRFFHAVLEQVKAKHAVDESRIYLFGHSAGAVHALVLAIVDSRFYAAVAVHAGALPPGNEKPLFAQADRRTPIAIWVGSNDPLFSVDAVTATKREFEQNGFQVELSIIPNHDHNYYAIADRVNSSAWDFLKKAQLKESSIAAPHQAESS
jgi:poly(3-hydroxybutyrate) depolymerase